MMPDQRGANWWQKIRRAATGLRAGIASAGNAAAIPDSGDADAISWIEPEGLAQRLENGSAPVIVDVRGADEFNGSLGHLPDAANIALPELPARIGELARHKERDLVLVCHTQMRSAQAAQLLNQAGFGKVAVLRGGMVEWRRLGLPVAEAGSAPGA
jgi:rhodanese-related sulfurtransferase